MSSVVVRSVVHVAIELRADAIGAISRAVVVRLEEARRRSDAAVPGQVLVTGRRIRLNLTWKTWRVHVGNGATERRMYWGDWSASWRGLLISRGLRKIDHARKLVRRQRGAAERRACWGERCPARVRFRYGVVRLC